MIDIELIQKKVLEKKQQGEKHLHLDDFFNEISYNDLITLENLGFKIVAGMKKTFKERDLPNPRMSVSILF